MSVGGVCVGVVSECVLAGDECEGVCGVSVYGLGMSVEVSCGVGVYGLGVW